MIATNVSYYQAITFPNYIQYVRVHILHTCTTYETCIKDFPLDRKMYRGKIIQ